MDLADARARFLDGLATEAVIDRELLDRPGTTVIGRDDRAGSRALACYHLDAHLVIWGDPAVVERATGLAGPVTLESTEVERRLDAAGFRGQATVISNLLDGPPAPPLDLVPGYLHRWLDGAAPGVVDAIAAFTRRCDPDEVEAAALDELDDFDEAAINVVIPKDHDHDHDHDDDDPPHILAYASASRWDWDPALADIGVLVEGALRRRGLARFVVANTVARLIADGRIPLYRHELDNVGSASVAAGAGFHPIARLDYFVSADPVDSGASTGS